MKNRYRKSLLTFPRIIANSLGPFPDESRTFLGKHQWQSHNQHHLPHFYRECLLDALLIIDPTGRLSEGLQPLNVALRTFFAKPFIVVVDTSGNDLNVKLYTLRGGEERSGDSLCDSEMTATQSRLFLGKSILSSCQKNRGS